VVNPTKVSFALRTSTGHAGVGTAGTAHTCRTQLSGGPVIWPVQSQQRRRPCAASDPDDPLV